MTHPTGTWGVRARWTWKAGERLLIENFGDADPTFGATADGDPTTNKLGLLNDGTLACGSCETVPAPTYHRDGERRLRFAWTARA